GRKAPHLMCGKPWRGIAAVAICTYFAYASYSHLRNGDVGWYGEWWTVATWAIWGLLIAGLMSETPCRRERLLLGVIVINLLMGLVFSAWAGAPVRSMRMAREASLLLWLLAIL